MANDFSPDPRHWSDAWLAEQHRAAVLAAAAGPSDDPNAPVFPHRFLADVTAEITRRHSERPRHHGADCRKPNAALRALHKAVAAGKPIDWDTIAPPRLPAPRGWQSVETSTD